MTEDNALLPPAEEWTVASQAVLVQLLTRLAQSSPELRVLVAQTLGDTARAFEILASCEHDRENRSKFVRFAGAVEHIHNLIFGVAAEASNHVRH